MECPRWNNHGFGETQHSLGLVLRTASKCGLKAAESPHCINSTFSEYTGSESSVRIGSLAFAPETTLSKMTLDHVAHLGSVMRACGICSCIFCKRLHVSLQNHFKNHTQPWWTTWEHLHLCPTCRSGTLSSDWAALAPCPNCRSAAFIQASQDRAQNFSLETRNGCGTHISSTNGCCAHLGTPKKDRHGLPPSEKGHAVDLVNFQGHIDVWSAATHQPHHCAAVLTSSESSVGSNWAQVHEPWPHLLPSRQHQALRRAPHQPDHD